MPTTAAETAVTLPRNSNQALGIAQFACDFVNRKIGEPGERVVERTELFHLDAVLCGLSAIALGTNAPAVLRKEALAYPDAEGVSVFGSTKKVAPEKAILANCSAVREWDSNGTNFGYNPEQGHTAGEFGHNDFYAVPITAAQLQRLDGAAAVRGMILLDEIRGRLAEVFSLKSYRIDHVVHGAIASAATFGAMMGATPEEIEHAIGMVVAHYIPFRAIRAGKQLSDSKGASAAISTEAAIIAMRRAMRGFIGPKDIFRNPQAIFRLFEPTDGDCPFDLTLSHSGDDFAVMGMHFKLGLYEHQSAGALQALIDLISEHPHLVESSDAIERIAITAYEPAYSIIGDPAKRDPRTRQSADHSMVYIVSSMLRKAIEIVREEGKIRKGDDAWKQLMLLPADYSAEAIKNPETRGLMKKIDFRHGGAEYDAKYPEGIPTSMTITDAKGETFDSGLIMFPAGHARNEKADLRDILQTKFMRMAELASDSPREIIDRFTRMSKKSIEEIESLCDFVIVERGRVD